MLPSLIHPPRPCATLSFDPVYGCSDMTECVPGFEFAPQRTFTVADAARASGKGYVSHFGGKWHLGSFYNDSEQLGGITSSPVTHGFDMFNATVEVSPTATTNCQCNAEWQPNCDYGHYGKMTHCSGGPGPDPNASNGCCFNYWWNDDSAPHSVTNLTIASPDDDSTYNADSFIRFLESRAGAPFLAQVSTEGFRLAPVERPQSQPLHAFESMCRCLSTIVTSPLWALPSASHSATLQIRHSAPLHCQEHCHTTIRCPRHAQTHPTMFGTFVSPVVCVCCAGAGLLRVLE
jgi:hypothetical protein